MNNQDIVQILKEDHVTLEFVKANGEIRKMKATLKPSDLPENETYEGAKGKKYNPDVQAVFDVENSGWRSFRWDKLMSVNGVEMESVS